MRLNSSLRLFAVIILVVLTGCKRNELEIESFNAFSNFKPSKSGKIHLNMDLSDANISGITIPTLQKNEQSNFKIQARLKGKGNEHIYYALFYQNESYKQVEFSLDEESFLIKEKLYNKQSSENFYGSWGLTETTFKPAFFDEAGVLNLLDSFIIQGNPRNEEQYFGAEIEDLIITEEKILRVVNQIKSNKDWYNSVKEKAEKSNDDLEQQLRLDAIWILNDNRHKGKLNHRWKRNPRTGEYSTILVVLTEKQYKLLPNHIKNIQLKPEGKAYYVNPYYYFLHGKGSENATVLHSSNRLSLKANLLVNQGILDSKAETNCHSEYCNSGINNFKKAHFEVYNHSTGGYENYNNIPVIADVVNEGYSVDQYFKNKNLYSDSNRLVDHIRNSSCSCSDVSYSEQEKALKLVNRGNDNTFIKQNVGVKSRIGFTYGKVTAKIKFPKLINTDNVWNGITCAVWMLYQDNHSWNQRNICEDTGYLPRDAGVNDGKRVGQHSYSEIDIEIVKTSKNWQSESYAEGNAPEPYDASKNHNLAVTCTNWDLACTEPSKFFAGAKRVFHENDTFHLNRWDSWYKAVTSKYEYDHDLTVGSEIYYQIDWQPNQIIWRIGADKENLKTVAVMDSSFTKIPNNQMIMVMTQEWHLSNWWHMAPFKQDNIPFPKNDIVGYLYGIEVE